MAERAHPKDAGFKDKWFGLKKSRYKAQLYERYKFCNTYIRGKTVLDIPCGVGWGASLLRGSQSVIGIDISPGAIEFAKKQYRHKRMQFYVGNMESICLEDNVIDVIICLEGFEHISREACGRFIEESKRVLKTQGLLIMSCPVLNEYGQATGNPYHIYEYPEDELIETLNKNFRILNLERTVGPDGPEYRAVLCNTKKRLHSDL